MLRYQIQMYESKCYPQPCPLNSNVLYTLSAEFIQTNEYCSGIFRSPGVLSLSTMCLILIHNLKWISVLVLGKPSKKKFDICQPLYCTCWLVYWCTVHAKSFMNHACVMFCPCPPPIFKMYVSEILYEKSLHFKLCYLKWK